MTEQNTTPQSPNSDSAAGSAEQKPRRFAALRTKRVLIPAGIAAAVLVAGGTTWAAVADDDVKGDERDRVSAAALDIVGGGEVTSVETSDDPGEAYEVEVRTDGREVDVTLDDQLREVSRDDDRDDAYDDRDDRDDRDDARDDSDDATDDRDDSDVDGTDSDDRVLSDSERQQAERAALAEVPGTVIDVDAENDPGVAYDVEVRDAKGAEWHVDLAADFSVVSSRLDD